MTVPTVDPDEQSVAEHVTRSIDCWARDLRAVFDHAQDRFGDVTWYKGESNGELWAHKAIIYCRAPKSFKDRYFVTTLSRTLHQEDHRNGLPSTESVDNLVSPISSILPRGEFTARVGSSLPDAVSVSASGRSTLRSEHDGVLRLGHVQQSDLLQTQLEWLYTGEGLGDVVDWISDDIDHDIGAQPRDSLGCHGDRAQRRDKLGQDLTYMWRSKLYADVRIHLGSHQAIDVLSEDSHSSAESVSTTATFTGHRFILASRSPYFASVLFNTSSFLQPTADITLPAPPFTPAALHFCLGYMYAGHLAFSNRSFDLSTAFQIHRAATYLQMDLLVAELESIIVDDFCHGLRATSCRCKQCHVRIGRVWRFARASDVHAMHLERRAEDYLASTWYESWGREVGLASEEDRQSLVSAVCSSISSSTMIATFRSLSLIRSKCQTESRLKGRHALAWTNDLIEAVDSIETYTVSILVSDFDDVVLSKGYRDLIEEESFDGDLLEAILEHLVCAVSSSRTFGAAPHLYQTLVASAGSKLDILGANCDAASRAYYRRIVGTAKCGLLDVMRRRWLQISATGGFCHLEQWSLEEISDEIGKGTHELVGSDVSGLPHRASNRHPPADTGQCSLPVKALTTGEATIGQRDVALPSAPVVAKSPLKRLRLGSSASPASAGSPAISKAIRQPTTTTRVYDSSTSPGVLVQMQSMDKSAVTHHNRAPNLGSKPSSGSEVRSRISTSRVSSELRDRARAGPRSSSSSLPSPSQHVPIPATDLAARSACKSPKKLSATADHISSRTPADAKPPIRLDRGRAEASITATNTSKTAFRPVRLPAEPQANVSCQVGHIHMVMGVRLSIGIPCIVYLQDKRARFTAAVRYIGQLKGLRGAWLGLEVDDLSRLHIKTLETGMTNGMTYFDWPKDRSKPCIDDKDPNLLFLPQVRREGHITQELRNEALLHDPTRRALFVRPSEVMFIFGTDSA